MLEVSWRWYVMDQFWKRGKVNPFGVTAIGAVAVGERRVDEGRVRRRRFAGTRRRGKTRETRRWTGSGRAGWPGTRVSDSTGELIEKATPVIDSVAAADGVLVSESIRQNPTRGPQASLSGASGTFGSRCGPGRFPRKSARLEYCPRPGSACWIERRVPIVTLGAGELVVEAQA